MGQRRSFLSGFTLLEVLVALAIFALAASVLLVADGRAIRQTARVQDLVQASWIADAHLNRYYVEESFPSTGRQSTTVEHVGRSWVVHDLITETSEPALRRIEVQVFPGNGKVKENAKPLYRLTGYIRRPVYDQ